jgi:peptidoglycan/xylan/chitin deacetylase (PgdA/CDA1 family)
MSLFRVPVFIQSIYRSRQWKGVDKDGVYLTFDDGPEDTTTNWLLEFLKKENIKATFFCLGKQIENHPILFQKILENGHAIGNHTFNHEKGSDTDCQQYINSIVKTDNLMNSKLFRPPYGRLSRGQSESIRRMGKKIIMWTWNSHDYDQHMKEEIIIKKATSIKGGDILLFHNSIKSADHMITCLPQIIHIIKKKNLAFKTLT